MARGSGGPTTPDLVVLSLLAEKPRHGYDVNRVLELRDVRDWAGISRPQVYYSLGKLRRRKWIRPVVETAAAQAASAAGGPDREVYAITATGRAALTKALDRPAWAEQRPPPPFLTWMALSMHAAPSTVREQLDRRRRFLEVEAARERKTLAEFAGHTGYATDAAVSMVELTIEHFEIELRWLKRARGRLTRYTDDSL